MKKLIFSFASLLLCFTLGAQSANYAPGKVAFCPVFDTAFSGWSQEITDLMQNKLTQIVMQNGVGSFSEQYVLTAKIALEDKQVTATAPAQYIVKLAVQLQAVDVNAQILIRELTLNLTGVDRSENRAYMDAIRKINPRNPLIKSFIQEASDAAITAYNNSIGVFLNDARSLEEAGQYDEALYTLAQIPKDVDRYDEVMALSGDIVAKQNQTKKAQAAAQAARDAEKAAAEEEAQQRERDLEIQKEMMAAMQKKQEKAEKTALVAKVKQWFLGSLA